ncbi:hypothetical protein L6D11_13995 [Staphylococcus aureus]|nr:hypothetical protein [Staphylococcus aureus]
MNINNKAELKDWINNNLLVKQEVLKEYGIKTSLFDVMVARHKITPFLRKGRMNLYLRSEVETVFKDYMHQN